MSNLQPNWCLQIELQKVDQHTEGKWSIHDTKRRKNNQLQSLKHSYQSDGCHPSHVETFCQISHWYTVINPGIIFCVTKISN